jgi:hypothetical protein
MKRIWHFRKLVFGYSLPLRHYSQTPLKISHSAAVSHCSGRLGFRLHPTRPSIYTGLSNHRLITIANWSFAFGTLAQPCHENDSTDVSSPGYKPDDAPSLTPVSSSNPFPSFFHPSLEERHFSQPQYKHTSFRTLSTLHPSNMVVTAVNKSVFNPSGIV